MFSSSTCGTGRWPAWLTFWRLVPWLNRKLGQVASTEMDLDNFYSSPRPASVACHIEVREGVSVGQHSVNLCYIRGVSRFL